MNFQSFLDLFKLSLLLLFLFLLLLTKHEFPNLFLLKNDSESMSIYSLVHLLISI